MDKYTVLIAEDDRDIVNILKIYLESHGYCVIPAYDGAVAFELIQTKSIDLAIVDIMIPRIDGFTLTKQIRKIKDIPIMILTAKIDDNDKILGLNLGADDYLTKPFNPLEILARVNANLRRFYKLNRDQLEGRLNGYPSPPLSIGELELDLDMLTLKKNNREIPLTPIEYKLLVLMMKSPGRVYTKSQLCEAVYGELYDHYENAIMVHISHLRDKIEDDSKNPSYIKTIRGVGYKIENR